MYKSKSPFLPNRRFLIVRPKFYSDGFKKPGKDGFGIFRAILLSGPPGIGKTTSAHLMAKMKGYSPIEMNASDTRSKKLIEVSLFLVFFRSGLPGPDIDSSSERYQHRQCFARWLVWRWRYDGEFSNYPIARDCG